MIFPASYYFESQWAGIESCNGFLSVNGGEAALRTFYLIWWLVRHGSVRFLKLFV